jgi:hypothetical protein
LFVVAAWALCIAVTALLSRSLLVGFFLKYNVSIELLMAAFLLGCGQVGGLFEFIFIARDLERRFLQAAAGYLALVGVVATVATTVDLPLLVFVGLLALCKLFYVLILVLLLVKPNDGRSVRAALKPGHEFRG